jgi:hypothetical protein
MEEAGAAIHKIVLEKTKNAIMMMDLLFQEYIHNSLITAGWLAGWLAGWQSQ